MSFTDPHYYLFSPPLLSYLLIKTARTSNIRYILSLILTAYHFAYQYSFCLRITASHYFLFVSFMSHNSLTPPSTSTFPLSSILKISCVHPYAHAVDINPSLLSIDLQHFFCSSADFTPSLLY